MPLAVFTGGGTAGHIIPGLAVIQELQAGGWRAAWIGTRRPAERELVHAAGIPFYGIPAGKLRRYLSLRNLTDVVAVLAGCVHALILLLRLRPAVLFAKGSFVSVPPVVAARLLGIPVVTHESDATPALATRINATMARTVLVAFAATRALLPARLQGRVQVTGNPLRAGLARGDAARARARFQVPEGVPLLLVTGGSSGARALNELVQRRCRRSPGAGSGCTRPAAPGNRSRGAPRPTTARCAAATGPCRSCPPGFRTCWRPPTWW